MPAFSAFVSYWFICLVRIWDWKGKKKTLGYCGCELLREHCQQRFWGNDPLDSYKQHLSINTQPQQIHTKNSSFDRFHQEGENAKYVSCMWESQQGSFGKPETFELTNRGFCCANESGENNQKLCKVTTLARPRLTAEMAFLLRRQSLLSNDSVISGMVVMRLSESADLGRPLSSELERRALWWGLASAPFSSLVLTWLGLGAIVAAWSRFNFMASNCDCRSEKMWPMYAKCMYTYARLYSAFLNVEYNRLGSNFHLIAAVRCVTLRRLLVKVLIALILLGNMSAKHCSIFSLTFGSGLLF